VLNFGASNSVLFASEVTGGLSAQILRLYNVDGSALRFEGQSEAALLDCCFQNESVAFSAASDGSVTRWVWLCSYMTICYLYNIINTLHLLILAFLGDRHHN
jgi:hypothetical protein